MQLHLSLFFKYVLSKQNRVYLLGTLVVGIIYFIILRFLYPIPSYYSDSFTWVGAAQTGQPVSFRPIGYSKLLMFFRYLSKTDVALIAGQFFLNLLANLGLFFTCTWFFKLKKGYKLLLYILLILNPFYLFYSNYVSSDAFFNCFTVIWFTLLIWIIHNPKWYYILAHLVVLAGLFELRYNAIFFPVITALALLLSKLRLWKKITSIGLSFLVVAALVIFTTYQTKSFTKTKTFSAFSGWQLANDALHVMQHDQIDTNRIKDTQVKSLVLYLDHFFDTARQTFPDSGATAVFMWHPYSPLKTYMKVYPYRKKSYFATWNALGPLYSKFGQTIILQKPVSYIQHFVIHNVKAYFLPPLEIYETYMEGRTVIPAVVLKFYKYKSDKVPRHYPQFYNAVFKPVQYIFIIVNILLPLFAIYYVVSKKFKKQSLLFNQTLLCFGAFYVANFFFVVLLAPSVFRYHVFILTLSFPVLLYLVQQLGAIATRKPKKVNVAFKANGLK